MSSAGSQASNALDLEAKPRGRLLLVDDDPHFLHILARLLKAEELEIHCAPDAEAAAQILSRQLIDVVITDLKMPECDGLGLVRKIRATASNVPVIILTACGDADAYLEAMNAGADECLDKPVDTQALLHAVCACLNRRAVRHRRTGESSKAGAAR